MRIIKREELPELRFWVKYPGYPRWFIADYEVHNLQALVITVNDTPFSAKTVTAENAANEGYLWNDQESDNGARPFYVEEPGDVELRNKLASAGEGRVRIVLKSSVVYDCTRSYPSFISPAYVGEQDEYVAFEVMVNGKPRLFRWHEVADVVPLD